MSSPEEREVIRLNFAQLTKNLNPTEIIDDMRGEKLLTLNEHSDIETKTKESRRDGVSTLLKALQRRQSGSLKVLIDLLKKVEGSEYLATKLAADLDHGEWVPCQSCVNVPCAPLALCVIIEARVLKLP